MDRCAGASRRCARRWTLQIVGGDPIEPRLPPGTDVDVRLLAQDALPAEEMGPLLGGIDPQAGPKFSTWLLAERARIAAVIDGKIRREAMRALALGEHDRAIRLAESAVRRDAFDESARDLTGIHAVVAFNLVDWGRIEAGLARYRTSLEYARTAGDRRSETWSLGMGARGQLAAGSLDDAEAWLHDCLGLVDDTHWVAFRPWPAAALGELKLRRQEAPAGLRGPLEEAYALGCRLRDPCSEAAAARCLALTYAAEGELATAIRWLDDAYGRCIRETDAYVALRVEILADRAEANQRLGRVETASTLARELVGMAARTHIDAHLGRAAAFLAARNTG